jgi:hypothetical protein
MQVSRMTTPPPSRFRTLRIAAPLIIVLVLAAGWTAVWIYAAGRADAVIAAWIDREARDGRTYSCAQRSLGGYPFRIELRCAEPAADLTDSGRRVTLKARQLTAVAQVYQPDLVIAEVTGPMTIAGLPGDPEEYTAEWTLLQASLRGRPHNPQRISIVVDRPRMQRAGAPVANAERFEFHARRRPGSDEPLFDIAGRVVNGGVQGFAAWMSAPFNAELAAVLHGLKDFSAKPLSRRLREWQAAGGRLELANARLQQGQALAVAKGSLGLNADGRLDGTVTVTMAGFDQLVSAILGAENRGRAQTGLLAGLSLLGRAELEGRRAIAMPLSFRDGRVFFGPVPIARTVPLF